MEFHKPKPIHSLRELLTEIGVIVIGVAIALAAEQGVEWLHWQSEVSAARKSLAAEIAFDNLRLARRIAYHPCTDRNINEAEAAIADLEARRVPKSFAILHPGMEQLFDDSQWQSQRASQVVTHFPDAELALLSRYYAGMDAFRLWMDREGVAWADLSVLQNPPAGLAASDFLRLRASLTIARRMNDLNANWAGSVLRISQQLGISPPAIPPERVEKFCTSNDAEFAAWQNSHPGK